jgi:hypothetical protein
MPCLFVYSAEQVDNKTARSLRSLAASSRFWLGLSGRQGHTWPDVHHKLDCTRGEWKARLCTRRFPTRRQVKSHIEVTQSIVLMFNSNTNDKENKHTHIHTHTRTIYQGSCITIGLTHTYTHTHTHTRTHHHHHHRHHLPRHQDL